MKNKIEAVDQRNQKIKTEYTKLEIEGVQALQYILDTIDMAMHIDYVDGIFEGVIGLVLFYAVHNEAVDAMSSLNRAEMMLDTNNLTDKHRLTYLRAYAIYAVECVSNLSLGIELYESAIELAEELYEDKILKRLKANLGVVYILMEHFDFAEPYLKDAIEYSRSMQDQQHLAYDCYNMGQIKMGQSAFDQAKVYLKESVELCEKYDYPFIYHSAQSALAKCYNELGNYQEAIIAIDKAIEKSHIGSTHYDLYQLIFKAEIHAKNDEYLLAKTILDEYLPFLETIENIHSLKDFHKMYSDIACHLGLMDLAYDHLKRSVAMEKKLAANQTEAKLHRLMQEEYKKTVKKLKQVSRVGRELTMNNSIETLVAEIEKNLESLLKIDSVGIGILRGDVIYYDHYYVDRVKLRTDEVKVQDPESFAAWCVRNRKTIRMNDFNNEYRIYVETPLIDYREDDQQSVQSLIYAPLIVKDEVLGTFTIQSYQKHAYTTEDLELFNIIASYVAIAIKNMEQAKLLESLSVTDSLTGILNRRGFLDYYETHVNGNDRCNAVALMMMDLDNFKCINDNYGHHAGDYVLQSIVKVIQETIPDDAVFARLGGEEFAILLKNYNQEEIYELSEGIRKTIAHKTMLYDNHALRVTLSIGFCYDEYQMTYDYSYYYKLADQALYDAKDAGKNRVVYNVVENSSQ